MFIWSKRHDSFSRNCKKNFAQQIGPSFVFWTGSWKRLTEIENVLNEKYMPENVLENGNYKKSLVLWKNALV